MSTVVLTDGKEEDDSPFPFFIYIDKYFIFLNGLPRSDMWAQQSENLLTGLNRKISALRHE
jgi:hypothetical protein